MMAVAAVRTALTWAWWLIVPPFAALVLRLSAERACAAPYELLPDATAIPALASMLAALYVAAHALLIASWLVTAVHADALLPPIRTIRAVWGRQTWMLFVIATLVVMEYWPVVFWRVIGRTVGCAQ